MFKKLIHQGGVSVILDRGALGNKKLLLTHSNKVIMKLTKVRIKNYKSIHDSTEFDIDDITCLVGKNESGKTAILEALHKFNPVHPIQFDRLNDYPVENPQSHISETDVVEATFSLEREDIEAIETFIHCECVDANEPTITFLGGYSNTVSVVKYGFDLDLDAIIKHISTTTDIKTSSSMKDPTKLAKDLLSKVDFAENTHYYGILEYIASSNLLDHLYHSILHARTPQFIYFDEYPLMPGVMDINELSDRIKNDQIQPLDQPIVKILEAARVNYDVLIEGQNDNERGIEIKKTENAINKALNEILESWSQHKVYRMESQVLPSDSGVKLNIYITDRRKPDSYETRKQFQSESHGFLWFFSFLMTQKHFYTDDNDVILLLDEPGVSLHAKAKKDLLQFFEHELASRHQVIYTTHSPFLIDLGHLNRVRTVENKSLEEESNQLNYSESGTKVSSEVHSAGEETLIPLQSALGYDISQGVFIGRNYLIVEGESDEIYIRAISSLLKKKGRRELGPWNIVPANGIDKVLTFVKLFGATGLNLVVLVDRHRNEKQKIKNLYSKGTINKDRILTYADFTEKKESDVEDMLTPEFYLELVNETYGISIEKAKLPRRSRIISRLESHFKTTPIPDDISFSHLKPAEYLMENIESIKVPEEVLSRFERVFNKLLVLSTQQLADFVSATPLGGEIDANGSITVTFDNAPANVTVSAGTVTVAGKTATIAGPFIPGPLALTITWADRTKVLNYTVAAPDTDPPAVTGGTVKDGDKDVDPEAINTDGKIEVEFSKDVSGNVALQTKGGDDIGWLGKVEGKKGTLELLKGKEISSETTYVIKGKVSDAAGNSTDVSVTFVTKGVADGTIGKAYWDKFKTYVKENGNQLQLFPEPDLPSIYGIQIDPETRESADIHRNDAFWLVAYRSRDELQAKLCVQSSIHYNRLKKHRRIINQRFGDNLGELKWEDGKKRIGFSNNTVSDVKTADINQEFPWLYDRLLRLQGVFQPLSLTNMGIR